VYGISKLAGELAVRNANPDALVIRTAAVYGGATGSREKKGNFVLYILKEMAEKTDLEVSSEQITSPTFAGHLAAAIYQLLQRSAAGGVYHLAGAGQCSWAEFAQEIVRVKGGELKIELHFYAATVVIRSGQY
jgi:dTDP-4-dehydrorhamnose reductase